MTDSPLEIQSFPFYVATDFELKLPEVVEFLGIEHRPKEPVRSGTLFLVALVRPSTPETVYKFRLGMEGVAVPPGFSSRPLGNCRVEKPRPVTYWLFGIPSDPA